MPKAKKVNDHAIKLTVVVLILFTLSLIVNVVLLVKSSQQVVRGDPSNEQIVRDMIIYRESYNGLQLDQAIQKAKEDRLLYRIDSRNGEPLGHTDIRITPVGSIVAGFNVITNSSGEEIVQSVSFMGEHSHFKYLDILREKGQSAASKYAKDNNLH